GTDREGEERWGGWKARPMVLSVFPLPNRHGRGNIERMILAPLADPVLRATVRRAALPEEDVFHRIEEVSQAMRFGFPRLLVYQPEDRFSASSEKEAGKQRIPVLAITGSTLRRWESAWRAQGLASSRIDVSALRLRTLMRAASGSSNWVDWVFADLTLILGRGLPDDFKGFARRVMEYPARYSSLSDLGRFLHPSPGALKARFRRRGLPSPSAYLRWFRVVAAGRLLADPQETTLTSSFRMGFTSDGNFCRWVQATCGYPPSALRGREGRMLVLLRLATEMFPPGAMEAWESLGGVFLREIA
ncbi:MAG: helix-turn-helix domain-containing protein, partial [Longimicrobiales bacterium]